MAPAKRGALKACYNIQTAAEPESHIITGFQVTNHANDVNLMHDAAQEARENLGVKTLCVTVDKGYESRADIEKCVLDGIMPDVGFRCDREERVINRPNIPVRMYGSPRYPLQQIPDIDQPDHYHAYGRVSHAPAKVVVFIRRDKALQKERIQTNEHPFGIIKHYDGAGYFLCRGKEKVAAETALMYLSYNIRLASGVQRLIARFRARLASGIPILI